MGKNIWRSTARKVIGNGLLTEARSLWLCYRKQLWLISSLYPPKVGSDLTNLNLGEVSGLGRCRSAGRERNMDDDRAEGLWQGLLAIWPKAQKVSFVYVVQWRTSGHCLKKSSGYWWFYVLWQSVDPSSRGAACRIRLSLGKFFSHTFHIESS